MMKGTIAPGTSLTFTRLIERLHHHGEAGRLGLVHAETGESAWIDVGGGKILDGFCRDLTGDPAVKQIKELARWSFEFPISESGASTTDSHGPTLAAAAAATTVNTVGAALAGRLPILRPLKVGPPSAPTAESEGSRPTLRPGAMPEPRGIASTVDRLAGGLRLTPMGGSRPSENKPESPTDASSPSIQLSAEPRAASPHKITLASLQPGRSQAAELLPTPAPVADPVEVKPMVHSVISAPPAAETSAEKAPSHEANLDLGPIVPTTATTSIKLPTLAASLRTAAIPLPTSPVSLGEATPLENKQIDVEWPVNLPLSPSDQELQTWTDAPCPLPRVTRFAFNDQRHFGMSDEELEYFRSDYGFFYQRAVDIGAALGLTVPHLLAMADSASEGETFGPNSGFKGRAVAYKSLGGDLVVVQEAIDHDVAIASEF